MEEIGLNTFLFFNKRINTKLPGEQADVKDEQQERKIFIFKSNTLGVVMIEKRIQELLDKVEEAGDDGKVEEAKAFMIEAEKHKVEMELVRRGEDPLSQADRRMEVCTTCGTIFSFIY